MGPPGWRGEGRGSTQIRLVVDLIFGAYWELNTVCPSTIFLSQTQKNASMMEPRSGEAASVPSRLTPSLFT